MLTTLQFERIFSVKSAEPWRFWHVKETFWWTGLAGKLAKRTAFGRLSNVVVREALYRRWFGPSRQGPLVARQKFVVRQSKQRSIAHNERQLARNGCLFQTVCLLDWRNGERIEDGEILRGKGGAVLVRTLRLSLVLMLTFNLDQFHIHNSALHTKPQFWFTKSWVLLVTWQCYSPTL